MNLIPISNNILVNPDHIGCIEQRKVRGEIVMFIYVDGVEYEYEFKDKVPIADFINILKEAKHKQYFAL